MLTSRFLSMRTSLGLVILVMGLLGMLLSIATGEIYRYRTLENQRQAFVELARLKVNELLNRVYQDGIELGLSAQSPDSFKQVFRRRDAEALTAQLDEQFHRAFVTLNIVKLVKIVAFDREFQPVALSSEGLEQKDTSRICSGLVGRAALRHGAERIKPLPGLCRVHGKPYVGVISPIGGLHLQGYLLLVLDPVPNLARAEQGLGIPLMITGAAGQQLYKSEHWPKHQSDENILLADYVLEGPGGASLKFIFASDITELRADLASMRYLIMLVASLLTLFTAFMALFVMQRTTLIPLNKLTAQLRGMRRDKSQLGREIKVSGNREIAELAEDFNAMSVELGDLYRTLENMAYTDELTGMANRALFYDRLQQLLLNSGRSKIQFALFMMDLNRFKDVNDTLGHHVGDEILHEVAVRLHNVLRKSDTLARLGGDEFAALLPVVDSDDGAALVARKISHILDEPIEVNGHTITIGVSIGIVRAPRDGVDSNQLVQRADVAMYEAKRAGKPYAFYQHSMDNNRLFELTMESELREVITSGALELYYQPKVAFASERVNGAEALIRWNHPKHGFIPPDRIVALAEQTGLIRPLTEWVLTTALSQCARWVEKGRPVSVSVNLSAHSLNDDRIVELVRKSLQDANVHPERLTLELTETAVMSDVSRGQKILSQLDTLGVKLSVDDFGTGYSSLFYLKHLPVDEIKIDKSFVIGMSRNDNDAVVVRTIIDLAHNMGLSVVAEGIEDKEVWRKLEELNCDVGQGFYMCRPCKPDQVERWLRDSVWGLGSIEAVV